jgi:hypothetical protein
MASGPTRAEAEHPPAPGKTWRRSTRRRLVGSRPQKSRLGGGGVTATVPVRALTRIEASVLTRSRVVRQAPHPQRVATRRRRRVRHVTDSDRQPMQLTSGSGHPILQHVSKGSDWQAGLGSQRPFRYLCRRCCDAIPFDVSNDCTWKPLRTRLVQLYRVYFRTPPRYIRCSFLAPSSLLH